MFFSLGVFACKTTSNKNEEKQNDLEELAFEGIAIDFEFNSKKPTFGDLFLMVGYENPDFPPKNRIFEKLETLDIEQIDDSFVIRDSSINGADEKLWIHPVVEGKEVFHHPGPFDAIRVSYVVVHNGEKTLKLLENVFNEMVLNLEVTPKIKGRRIENFEEIRKIAVKTITYCKEELGVKPGSDEALLLEW